MIIDSHAHWWPSDEYVQSKAAWKMLIKGLKERYYKPAGVDIGEDDLKKIFFDPDGSLLLNQMKEAGIDKCVILPLDWEKICGKAEKDIIEQNRVYAELSNKYPDKIISFFSINPERANAVKSFQTAVTEWGMKGLKLYPPTGFYPDDPLCTPFYEICCEYDLPVVFHGAGSPMSDTQFCHPDGFKRLADTFPELKIVIAHSGGTEWFKEAASLYRKRENIFMDISGFQGVRDTDIFKNFLKQLYDLAESFERIMFGTDNPIFNGVCKAADMVDAIYNIDLPEREKSNLLGNAAEKLL
jgi:uncharacterized protein